MSIITLTTDFGERDHYVGVMKGVILQLAPKATVVDITHLIPPQNILHAAFTIRQSWSWFPPGTIHMVVVDPGVGTSRRIIAGRYNERFFIAPDNGVISLVHHAFRPEAVHVVRRLPGGQAVPSATFHGRDIMAPIAAMLANRGRLDEVGPATDHLDVLDLPKPQHGANGRVEGQIIYIDQFGNCISNIPRTALGAAMNTHYAHRVTAGEHEVGPIQHTYADVKVGEAVALIGSTEQLEIAVNQGSAAERLALRVGSPVIIEGH